MSFEITVKDPERFGDLIRQWSQDPGQIPATIADFTAVTVGIVELGNGFQPGDAIAVFHAPPKQTLSIVIPNKHDLGDALPGGRYPLPDFYDDAYEKAPSNIPDKEVFRSKRISDYVMRKCV